MRERRVEEKGEVDAAAEDHEEDGGEVAGLINTLRIETAVTEEEAEEGLAATLETEMKVEEESEEEEGDGGTQQALEALEFLTQEAEQSRTTLVDAHNGFNELSRLAML